MRIVLDPVPLVLGIYAYVGELLAHAVERRDDDDAATLGKRMARQRNAADKDAQKLVRALHSEVKTADKLLKKTGDVWKISQETDLVELVIGTNEGEENPKAYVLLRPREIQPLLATIRSAAEGANEAEETLAQLQKAADALDAKSNEYVPFGFDPWNG
ncbi:MAG TPA: hypothetical protein VK911_10760 [Vicinamibacterales bacterium]|nr:hypothetical protein [Vicinamibacterales bacterium]